MRTMKTIYAMALSGVLFFALNGFAPAGSGIYSTKTGKVSFFSKTDVENIDATNSTVSSVLNTENGEMAFQMNVKSFEFEKALMQEHFNEKYVESDKYPKSSFKGKITDMSKVDFTKDGEYKTMVSGELLMHGVTNKVTVPASFTVKGSTIRGKSEFKLRPADYKIIYPNMVKNKISEELLLSCDIEYLPKK